MAHNIDELLEEYLRLHKALVSAADEQLKSIEKEDMSGFGEASDRRNTIQERIESLGKPVGSLFKKNKKDKILLEVREEVKGLIQEALDMDGRMLETASEKQDAISRELDRLKTGRKGVQRYGKVETSLPKFVDRES